MKMRSLAPRAVAAGVACLALATTAAHAGPTSVTGGTSSVRFDQSVLQGAGLVVSSSAGTTPGVLAGSVAFPINARDAAVRPTTFRYNSDDFLGTFTGELEHTGTISFNSDALTAGDFTVDFDAARVGGNRSGLVIISNTGLTGPLFDLQVNPGLLNPTETALSLGAELLMSQELSDVLVTAGLVEATAGAALVGADLGDLQVEATAVPDATQPPPGTAIPLPPAVAMGLVGLIAAGATAVRRRVV